MDIQEIINRSGLRVDYVAGRLFPDNKRPYNALLRVMGGKGQLSASQIAALSEVTGLTPNELFAKGPKWAGTLKNGSLVLRLGQYQVEYTSALNVYEIRRVTAGNVEPLGIHTAPANVTVKQFIEILNDQILPK